MVQLITASTERVDVRLDGGRSAVTYDWRGMQCLTCQRETPVDAAFCPTCGTRLPLLCGACGRLTRTNGGRCEHCGQPPKSPASLRDRRGAGGDPEFERRQLTVLFCDLVGSTALGQRLDPEEFNDLIRTFQNRCATAILRFEGHIAQYQGDGIIVYFGYPRAREDDAERAVRAGLAMQESLAGRNDMSSRHSLERAARIGIHTGVVVIGTAVSGSGHETHALGDTMNIAARVQSYAEPGGVVITETTLRLVSGLFVSRDLGVPPLRGVQTPIRVHAVSQASGVRHRLEAATSLTPLVGREQDLGMLLELWELAREGNGATVLLVGEAGVGKSRLLRALRERLSDQPHTSLDGYCSSHAERTPFQPVIEMVERGLGFRETDSPSIKLGKLEEGLNPALVDRELTVPYLVPFLSLPPSASFPLPQLAPDILRERTLTALVELMTALATLQPVLLRFEDLHWCDPSTLELLGALALRAPSTALLILCTARREFEAPWSLAASQVSRVTLSRLSRRHTRELCIAAGGQPLPEVLLAQLVDRADGIPLYAEELVRSVIDSGAMVDVHGQFETSGSATPLSIPATLQDSLMARLDRLGPVKWMAQICATLGREFRHDVLGPISGLDEDALQTQLTRLVDADILQQHGEAPDATYAFTHALLQDTAYSSLLKTTREYVHARIAHVLEDRMAEGSDTLPEALARHFTEGGLGVQAAAYYRRVGEQALERYANTEAVGSFRRAIELLQAGGVVGADLVPLRRQLAGALAGTGHRRAAAAQYLTAAADASPEERFELRRLAAYNLLRNGEVDEGLAQLRRLVSDVGLRWANGRLGAMLQLVPLRVRIAHTRYRYDLSAPALDAERQRLMELCLDLNLGLRVVEPLQSAIFSSRFVLLALQSGSARNVALALAVEAGTNAVRGTRRGPRAEALVAEARSVAERVGDPQLTAFVQLLGANVSFQEGDWRRTRELCERAEATLHARGISAAAEFDVIAMQLHVALYYAGALRDLDRRIGVALEDALRRGDANAARMRVGVQASTRLILTDDPESVSAGVALAKAQWSQARFQIQHLESLMAEVETLLYTGAGIAAREALAQRARDVRRTFVLLSQVGAALVNDLRGRTAVAAASEASDAARRRYLREARTIVRRLDQSRATWARGVAALVRAGSATIDQDGAMVRDALNDAVRQLEGAGMRVYGAAARYRLGELSHELRHERYAATEILLEAGVVNVERTVRMLTPGAW